MSSPLSNLAISPSGFVFDPRSGATFTVNATGRQLLEGIRDGMGLSALVSLMEEAANTQGADLRRDILEYARGLQEEGLLDANFELEQ